MDVVEMDEDLKKLLDVLKRLVHKYTFELFGCFCVLVLTVLILIRSFKQTDRQDLSARNKNEEINQEPEEHDDKEDKEDETESNSEGPSEGNKKEEIKQEPEELKDTEKKTKSHCYIKLSGLSWKATERNIAEFLEDCNIVGNVIIILNERGRPSGDALVKLKENSDLQKALKHNRKYLLNRYVIIEKIESDIYNGYIDTTDDKDEKRKSFCKLSGLVWDATEEDIKIFLHDCMIVEVVITKNERGKNSGDAFVHLDSRVDVQKATAHNHKNLRERFVIVEEIEEEQFLQETEGHRTSNLLGSISEKKHSIQCKKIAQKNKTKRNDPQILNEVMNDETKTFKFVVTPNVLVDEDDVMEECKEIQIDGVTWGPGKLINVDEISADRSEIELDCTVRGCTVAAEHIKQEIEQLNDVQQVTIIGTDEHDDSPDVGKRIFRFEIKPFDSVSDEDQVLEDCKSVELEGVYWDKGKFIKVSSSKSKIELGCTVENSKHTKEAIKNELEKLEDVEDVKFL